MRGLKKVKISNILAVCLLLILSGCGSGGGSSSAAPNPTPTVAWQNCTESRFQSEQFSCATLNVPLDYQNPGAGTTYLGIVKYQKYPSATQLLFFNNGGPWAVNTAEPTSFTNFPDSILQQYTIITFDPRGVGMSERLDGCSMPSPTGDSLMTQIGFSNTYYNLKGQFQYCFVNESSPLKYYMGTINTANDLDYIRSAMGYNQISYLGYSYGTQLGSLYLMLFTPHVDKMILDGNINPDHSIYTRDIVVGYGFTLALNNMLNLCNQNENCVLYPTAHESYDQFVKLIDEGKITVIPGNSTLTLGDFFEDLGTDLYNTRNYPNILNKIKVGITDHTYSKPLQGGFNRDSLVRSIVNKNDYNYTNLNSDNDIFSVASLYWNKFDFNAYNTLVELSNSYFVQLLNNSLPNLTYPTLTNKVLVIGNLYDPATPYTNSVSMSSAIPGSVLLALNSGNHCAYNVGISQCIDNYGNNYLLNGASALPPSGTLCDDALNPTSPTTIVNIHRNIE